METIRHFKKMSLWDFIELLEKKCLNSGDKEQYFIYLDEIKMRRIESISEGGNLKLKSLAKNLLLEFRNELVKNQSFCESKELEDFEYIVENEI